MTKKLEEDINSYPSCPVYLSCEVIYNKDSEEDLNPEQHNANKELQMRSEKPNGKFFDKNIKSSVFDL